MIIVDSEKERAINYLLAQTSAKTLYKIYGVRRIECTDWPAPYVLSLGKWVKDILRQGGFTWDDLTFAANWVTLIEQAAKSFVESHFSSREPHSEKAELSPLWYISGYPRPHPEDPFTHSFIKKLANGDAQVNAANDLG